MLAHLSVSSLFQHGSTHGTASEQDWIRLFDLYLPSRYRSASAFVVNSNGPRSRQIDLAIFDSFYSLQIFPRQSALYIPVESDPDKDRAAGERCWPRRRGAGQGVVLKSKHAQSEILRVGGSVRRMCVCPSWSRKGSSRSRQRPGSRSREAAGSAASCDQYSDSGSHCRGPELEDGMAGRSDRGRHGSGR